MGVLLLAVHIGQVLLSAKAAYDSYVAITNLMKYEKSSEKAAKYLNTAAHQLHKTRATQTSGALSLAASAVTAAILIVYSFQPTWLQLALNVVNVATTYAARNHLHNFWTGKWKVPMVGGYNQGIDKSKALVQQTGYLTLTWIGSSILTVIG